MYESSSNPAPCRPVVFLDIDDVLAISHRFDAQGVLAVLRGRDRSGSTQMWREIFHPPARQNLEALHEEFSPEYVITSSWVLDFSRDEIVQVFQHTGMRFVAENLHGAWTTIRAEESYRLTEIDSWLNEHTVGQTDKRCFVVIDDHRSGKSLEFSHLEDRTVFCDESIGFSHAQLVKARAILSSQ